MNQTWMFRLWEVIYFTTITPFSRYFVYFFSIQYQCKERWTSCNIYVRHLSLVNELNFFPPRSDAQCYHKTYSYCSGWLIPFNKSYAWLQILETHEIKYFQCDILIIEESMWAIEFFKYCHCILVICIPSLVPSSSLNNRISIKTSPSDWHILK